MISLCFSGETLLTSTFKKCGAIFKINVLDCTTTLLLLLHNRLKNLKEANNCQIAGAAKKLSGLPAHVMEYIMRECGPESCKVLRIVKQSQVFFQKGIRKDEEKELLCCTSLKWKGGRNPFLYMEQKVREHFCCIQRNRA